MEQSNHVRLLDAGWSYRANGIGWIVYHDPATGLWHAYGEAVKLLDSRVAV